MTATTSTLFVRLERQVASLELAELRARLYDRTAAPEVRHVLWSSVVHAAQNDPSPNGRHQLDAVWLALPFLRRTAWRITNRLRVCRDDLESELVTALLTAIAEVDTDERDVGSQVARSAINQGWRFAAVGSRERTTANIEAIATRRNAIEPVPDRSPAEDDWELHIAGPAGPDRLSATIRFISSPAHREGYRLGALASRLGLHEVISQARRPGEGEPIGALELTPRGGGS